MATRAEAPTSAGPADTAKLVAAGAIVVVAIVLFYVFAEQSLLARTIGLLVAFGAAAAVAYQSAPGRRAVAFFRDARTEVRKVVWPTRAETTQTTLTVLVIVIIVGILLWLFDMFLAALFRLVTGIGG